MVKKFLIFTSVCTVICTILALVILPFAVEDLAITANNYYESIKGTYDREFIEDTDNAKILYIHNIPRNLTIKKSTDDKIKYSWKNDLREVSLRTSKIDSTLIFQTERNYYNGANIFSRENVLKEITFQFYNHSDIILAELYVPDGIEVVLGHMPWGDFYVEDGVNCRIKRDDENMFNRPVKEPNRQEVPDSSEASSSEASPSAPSAPSAPPAAPAPAFIADTKAKLVEINNGYIKLYSDYFAKSTDITVLENGLNEYLTSEIDLFTVLMNGNIDTEQYIIDAREYADIIVDINIANISAKNLLAEYNAGTIQKPEYYERDLAIYQEIAQLEEAKQQKTYLIAELDELQTKYQIVFPFAHILSW